MVVPLNSSSSPSPSSRSTRMRNLKNTISTLGVNVNNFSFSSDISSKADRNGWGVVYNRSNCGYPYFRSYAIGGNSNGSACGAHVLSCDDITKNCALDVFYPDWIATDSSSKNNKNESFTYADIIWYAEYDAAAHCGPFSCDGPVLRSIQNKRSETPAPNNWNWRGINMFDYKWSISAALRHY